MENHPTPKKSLLRRLVGSAIVLAGLFIFLVPTTILVWGFAENYSNPCEEKLTKSRTEGNTSFTNNIDKERLDKETKDLCKAIRQKDLPILLAFGIVALSGLVLAVAGMVVIRGRARGQ